MAARKRITEESIAAHQAHNVAADAAREYAGTGPAPAPTARDTIVAALETARAAAQPAPAELDAALARITVLEAANAELRNRLAAVREELHATQQKLPKPRPETPAVWAFARELAKKTGKTVSIAEAAALMAQQQAESAAAA